ncbi:UvrD-helicase domain-containing protein [Methylocystis sp. JAN1]|uniref:UvrD-helicase domain-containing protein n=1 Tax=Methylocystis sp. JAN1 TaxID=3397211 RepID=UPI003FA29850
MRTLRLLRHLRSARMSIDQQGSVGLVTASAGTGKTYHLTERIQKAIANGQAPERILASTFTVKAAEELLERARSRLIADGDAVNAIRLLGARIGTINGVCGGLVKEFAFGLGLSPIVDVVDENVAKKAFLEAADKAIGAYADELGHLARLFGYEDAYNSSDWRKDVKDVVELARANNVGPDELAVCAERSFAGFQGLMRSWPEGETEADLDAAFEGAMATVLAAYATATGLKQKTEGVLEDVRDLASKDLADTPWQRWARLSKLDVAVPDKARFEPVKTAASAFARHPRLLDQVCRYTFGVFSCAAEAMRAYEAHKRAWGFVDFADQDRLALELLGKDELREQLSERVESVFIDEFQDTSPLQLAVFVAMSRIAKSSVWVGDPKQAIYGFRGTDPDLITHVAPKIMQATKGVENTLEKNWRSRPGLVAFFNDAFAPTFQAAGMSEKQTRIEETDRNDLPGQGTPLAVWHVEAGRGLQPRTDGTVAGIVGALANANDWLVADDGKARPLAAGDIAVLCRGNKACARIAVTLAKAGLKVAIERAGLFGMLEGRLALAALRWCADRRDTAALAELAHLLSDGEEQPAWFAAGLDDDRAEAIEALVPIAPGLRAVAEGAVHKTPLEFLDAVLIQGGVANAIARWGSLEDRLLNLEELRKLVAAYQDERDRERAPTTATDLCAWLGAQEASRPASRAADAVTVLTYHKSKGLEWPFVVLTDLEDEPKGDAFGVHVASDVASTEINWMDPLAERWIRFWPWPLGSQKDDVHFDGAAANSEAGREAVRADRAERARLLYVGATRARDYLVLVRPKTKKGWVWVDELRSASGEPAIAVPAAGDTTLLVNGVSHAARVSEPMPAGTVLPSVASIAYVTPDAERKEFPPLAVKPSEGDAIYDAKITDRLDLGHRLPFAGTPDMKNVGEAIHRFLAADDPSWDDVRRHALARRLLDAWGVSALDPKDVVTMGTRFRGFIDQRWPGAALRREAPIVCRMGDRTMSGRIDAVAETKDFVVVFDHKSFPGRSSEFHDQARKHAGQLRLYRNAIAAALPVPKPIVLALHLPISGEVLVVT